MCTTAIMSIRSGSNVVNYSVGMVEDFTELTNLKFGNGASCPRKSNNLS